MLATAIEQSYRLRPEFPGVGVVMRDVAERVRERQREWLQRIVREHNIKPTPLAKAAGVAATTITRKLNDPHDTALLSELSVARICAHLGIPAPNFLSDQPKALGFSEGEAAVWQGNDADPVASAIHSMIGTTLHLVPWQLRSQALLHEGYRPGDILIVDLNATPKPGDIVLVQLYDWRNAKGTETAFRLYEPPYLIASGPVEAAKRPRLIDSDDVAIKGVMTAMLRHK
ncbi:MAG: LexA family protein [Rhabdaerophilum sp.]